MAKPSRLFLSAVWGHWEARFGSTLALAVGAIQYAVLASAPDTSKLPDWIKTIPPPVSLGIGLVFLLWSCYAAWKDEHEELVEIKQRLRAPDLKLEIGSAWWGPQGPRGLMMTLGVSVANPTGPPTAVTSWSMTINQAGRISLGEFPLSPTKDITIDLANSGQKITLRTAESLIPKALTPIPSGGVVGGWIIAIFNDIDSQTFDANDSVVILTGKDVIESKTHFISFPLKRSHDGIYIPGKGLL